MFTQEQLDQLSEVVRRAMEAIVKRPEWQSEFEPSPFMTYEQVAEALQVSRKTISRLVASGRILTSEIGGIRRVPRSEIRRFEKLASAPKPAQGKKKTKRVARLTPAQEHEKLMQRLRG